MDKVRGKFIFASSALSIQEDTTGIQQMFSWRELNGVFL